MVAQRFGILETLLPKAVLVESADKRHVVDECRGSGKWGKVDLAALGRGANLRRG